MFDRVFKGFDPPVDGSTRSTFTKRDDPAEPEKQEIYVVQIRVEKADAGGVYFTHGNKAQAFVRLDGSTNIIPVHAIKERLGRPLRKERDSLREERDSLRAKIDKAAAALALDRSIYAYD